MAIKSKFNMGLLMDKLFRRTIYLRPLPDRSLLAIDITGGDENYLKDKTGATTIDPSCIVRVRGIKRIDYIALKLSDATNLLNIFDSQKVYVEPSPVKVRLPNNIVHHDPILHTVPETTTYCMKCGEAHIIPEHTTRIDIQDTPISFPEFEVPVPKVEVVVPSENPLTEKTFGDMLNYAESAGKMQAEHSPEADKKMNFILYGMVAAVLLGVLIFWKMNSGGT